MNKKFFISSERFVFLMVLTFFLMFFLSFGTFVLWLIGLCAYLYLIRRNKINYKDHYHPSSEVVISPVNGVVKSVYKKITLEDQGVWQCIEVEIPYFSEWGIYFPMVAEVYHTERQSSNRLFRFQKIDFRKKYSEDRLQFMGRTGHQVVLSLLPCPTSMRPRVWCEAGDRGRLGACAGFFPFGGTVAIYLPVECNVLVSMDDQIVAGETVLAGFN
jgi:hypothetical protein